MVNVRSSDGTVNVTVITNPFGHFEVPVPNTKVTYVITPTRKQYTFVPATAV
jgi:hypothetical protein